MADLFMEVLRKQRIDKKTLYLAFSICVLILTSDINIQVLTQF